MSKFWRVSEVPDNDNNTIRRPMDDGGFIVGPHAAAPHPSAVEVDLSTWPEKRLEKLKERLDIHGADVSEIDAALKPHKDVKRDKNPFRDKINGATPKELRTLVSGLNAAQTRAFVGHLLVEVARLHRRIDELESIE